VVVGGMPGVGELDTLPGDVAARSAPGGCCTDTWGVAWGSLDTGDGLVTTRGGTSGPAGRGGGGPRDAGIGAGVVAGDILGTCGKWNLIPDTG
jgi:hypothetical protein